jgi:hypothetical protein
MPKDAKIRRKPIWLGPNAIALIQIFEGGHNWDDIWTYWFSEEEDPQERADEAAKEFMRQMDEWYSRRFLEALKREIEKELAKEE